MKESLYHTKQIGSKYWLSPKLELTAKFVVTFLTDCYVNTFWNHVSDAYGELSHRTDINIPAEILMGPIF